MKTKLAIIAILLFLVGCKQEINSPESIAEKYLSELSSDLSEFGFYNARNHDCRSLVLMENEQADSIISGGKIPTMSELFDKYFQDDRHFYRWELMDISNDTIDIYKVFDLTSKEGKILLEANMNLRTSASKKIIRNEKAATFLDCECIPFYRQKYKIAPLHIDFEGDKYRIAQVGVIKHPEYGYKVVSFTWEE